MRIAIDPAEDWVEFGPPDARRRVGFHDYAALCAVPGLYERVFYDELGMCSTFEVARLSRPRSPRRASPRRPHRLVGRAARRDQGLADLLDGGEELPRYAYVHRRRADGSDDDAVALVGRRQSAGA